MPGPNYRWTCLACNNGNRANVENCESCGLPIDVDSVVIDGWRRSLKERAVKPSLNLVKLAIWGDAAYLEEKVAPCPNCKLHMYIWDGNCPHCDYELQTSERHSLVQHYSGKYAKGIRIGLIVFPAVILLALAIYYAMRSI